MFWTEFHQESMMVWDAEADGMTVNTREINYWVRVEETFLTVRAWLQGLPT